MVFNDKSPKLKVTLEYVLSPQREKCHGVFSGPYFPTFGLDMEISGVNLLIQHEYSKTRTRKNSVFGHFLRSALVNQHKKANSILSTFS